MRSSMFELGLIIVLVITQLLLYLCEYLCPVSLGIRQVVHVQSILCTNITTTAAVSTASALWLRNSNMIGWCVLKCYIKRSFVIGLVNVLNIACTKAIFHPTCFVQFRVVIWIRGRFQHIYHMLSVNCP